MQPRRLPSAIISNGHFKFILAPLAAEAARHELLALFLTGAYPSRFARRCFESCNFAPKAFQRYLQRAEPGIPPHLVRAKNLSEVFVQIGMLIRKVSGKTAWGQHWEMMGMRQYGRSAVGDVLTTKAGIYHYRSGYGHESALAARQRGMVTICDHSLPNPEVLDYLVQNGGSWPTSTASLPLGPWSRFMLPDIRVADYLVVNSEFVRESFVRYGWERNRIFVHYTGIDDDFMNFLPSVADKRNDKPRLLFAGELSRRKGTDVLVEALRLARPDDFRLDVIGAVHEDMAGMLTALRSDPRVSLSGHVPRHELAGRMAAADIFVFPSLAEGSARVVFMALAAGCYVITTPNAGSIVRDGEHGGVVAPGDPVALAAAIGWAVTHPGEIAVIGARNADLIRRRYTQSLYGQGVISHYKSISTPQ